MLGPCQLQLAPARKRLSAAIAFGRKILDFCEGSTDQCSLHIAWCLLAKSLREALAYDVRIIPTEILEPLLVEHAAVMRECTQGIFGRPLDDEDWQVMQLPG
eukprot:4549824-Karenia_brevis.AAC.1